ncbi:SDR family oxidoreductase [Ferrimonas lipolytica]|uniref:SDR family oxidoreductase n=1 Tax=Ferrimonas lipolytica TaxID=2724191 RepID=A0A6H1UKH4_9GAMM|nr:SDR family oxidoreductase [Ferrimonas lipolytica]QIZ78726.1 SDR family oxidoreductase [Ferrimonas lipolytica]
MSKRIVITGAASGLGLALALNYAKQGCKIAVADRQDGADAVRQIEAAGGEAFFQQCDVTDDTSMNALATAVEQRWGGVDVLVANAGVATGGAIEDESMEDWNWVTQINVLGVVRTCKVFLPLLRQGSQILCTASAAGLVGMPRMGSYCAGKSAVVSFAESMAIELAPRGIHVSWACPEFFKTNLDKSIRSNDPEMKEFVTKLLNKSGFSAEEIAATLITSMDRGEHQIVTHKSTRQVVMLQRILGKQRYIKMMIKKMAKFGVLKSKKQAA